MSLERKFEIKKQIAELEKELKILNETEQSHLDFTKLNEISKYGFSGLYNDFRNIVGSIHYLRSWRKDICGNNIIELVGRRPIKMRNLSQEEIKESNELLQKMLEPFAQKIKEKLKNLEKTLDNKDC